MSEASIERSGPESRPSRIDVHVGSQIRLRRTQVGMSQEELGDALGVAYQQVQKYESGANRVAASRLFDISCVLRVTISFFFQDMPEGMDVTPISSPRGRMYGFVGAQEQFSNGPIDSLTERETLELVRAYHRIPNLAVRKQMIELMKNLAPAEFPPET